VEVLDAAAHIEQVSGHPQGHRQGLGAWVANGRCV
jgi:hypothetical protein